MQEFLMKSNKWDGKMPGGNGAGLWVSEKMDGHRFFWDGGVTIGQKVSWSKDVSTGWWSNGGRAIRVPGSWTEEMKRLDIGPVEGELWGGRGTFQAVSSIVRATVSERDWASVGCYLTGPVLWDRFLDIRTIKVRNKVVGNIGFDDRVKWLSSHHIKYHWSKFGVWYNDALARTNGSSIIKVTPQYFTSGDNGLAFIQTTMDDVLAGGGEGLMLRTDCVIWMPKRCDVIMKYKGAEDGEATIVGVVEGQGRLQGMIGSLVVFDASLGKMGKRFEIGTGMDDYFRVNRFDYVTGRMIRYKYRELTNDDIPKEARFVCLIDEVKKPDITTKGTSLVV